MAPPIGHRALVVQWGNTTLPRVGVPVFLVPAACMPQASDTVVAAIVLMANKQLASAVRTAPLAGTSGIHITGELAARRVQMACTSMQLAGTIATLAPLGST